MIASTHSISIPSLSITFFDFSGNINCSDFLGESFDDNEVNASNPTLYFDL